MAIPRAPLNILTFPQKWSPAAQVLSLNVLIFPNGDPLLDFAPAFPDATLAFEAHLSSIEQLPLVVPAGPALVIDQDLVERRQFFDALIATFDQPDGTGFKVKPNVPGPPVARPAAIKKYLSSTYRAATGFAKPRTKMTVTDDSYECALRDGKMQKPSGPKASREFSWEEILAFVLRQPLLATKLGLIYSTELHLTDP